MNEQDKKLCERLLETNEDGSLVELTEDEQRRAAQAIERLSAEVEIEKGQNEILESANKAFFDELAALKAQGEPVATVGLEAQSWTGYNGQWTPPGEPRKVAMLLKDVPLGTRLYLHPPVVSEDAKDAARYRWLREQHGEQLPIAAVVWKKGSISSSAIWCDMIDAADLDKHIDAAIDKAMEANK